MNKYTLYTCYGEMFFRETSEDHITWHMLTDTKLKTIPTNKYIRKASHSYDLNLTTACPIPNKRERLHWGTVKAEGFEEAIALFSYPDLIVFAFDMEKLIVQKLDGGWKNQLIVKYGEEKTGFSFKDFFPERLSSMREKSFLFVLKHRKELVDQLDQLNEDFHMAERWQKIITPKIIKEILDDFDRIEQKLFKKDQTPEEVATDIETVSNIGCSIDFKYWAQDYVNKIDKTDNYYKSEMHKKHCRLVFEFGVSKIYDCLSFCRANILKRLLIPKAPAEVSQ